MDAGKKLFQWKDPYDLAGTDSLFIEALRQNAAFHMAHCPDYARICHKAGFCPEKLKKIEDLKELPVLPTLYLKRHELFSMERKRLPIISTSSGTSGKRSEIGFDVKSLYCGLFMVLRLARFHHILSPVPTRYLVLGYEAVRENRTSVARTMFGQTFFAPAVSRTYALKYQKGTYELDEEGIVKTLERASRGSLPLRICGFPSYTFFLLRRLSEEGISLRLPEGSRIFLGGGWKQFYEEEVEKSVLYHMAEERLGIPEERVQEFFGAVEHPVLYCDCKHHHFHVPVYARVLIRDIKTLEPVPYGTPGLVNLITPMLKGSPVVSVMTDDLGVLHRPEECGCGISSPFLELYGRVGISDIKTCATGAEAILKEENL